MGICPLCNGLGESDVTCRCGTKMVDSGKEMDYYDDYSAYMPIDQLKLEDGYPDSLSGGKCPHLFTCPNCLNDKVVFIEE
jgi:hypothetical protein